MSAPQRIQRKRVKGWRMPERTIYVGRPSLWGNPFTVGGFYLNRGPWSRTAPYPHAGPEREPRQRIDGFGNPYEEFVGRVRDRAHAVELFAAHVDYENVGVWAPDEIRRRLGGRDLCCCCSLDQPCHASVWLRLANEGAE